MPRGQSTSISQSATTRQSANSPTFDKDLVKSTILSLVGDRTVKGSELLENTFLEEDDLRELLEEMERDGIVLLTQRGEKNEMHRLSVEVPYDDLDDEDYLADFDAFEDVDL